MTLQDLDSPGKSYTYTLVGSEELAIEGTTEIQRISQRSPVGQAILNKKVGDKVVVKIPHGTRNLKITSIGRVNPAKKGKKTKQVKAE